MTPMPKQPPELPNSKRDSVRSASKNPPNSTRVTERSKTAHFATKIKKSIKEMTLMAH